MKKTIITLLVLLSQMLQAQVLAATRGDGRFQLGGSPKAQQLRPQLGEAGRGLTVAIATQAQSQSDYRQLIKQHIYADYKQMYRHPTGGALIYPYLTPGSKQYARVLWDWDSWLSDVALRQILADTGSKADRREALVYEQGCVLNYLAYTSEEDGYMPMVVDAESDPAKMKPRDIYSTNMHKPVIAQHAAFITQQGDGDATWLREGFPRMRAFIRNYQEHHRHQATGLFFWQDDLAIGVDNDPSTFFRPKRSSASIYLNCLMVRELQAMAYLSERLSMTEAARQYQADAEALRQAVRQYCWDEKDGMYYSVDLNLLPYTGEPQIIFGKPFVLHEGAPRDYPCLIQRLGSWSGFMTLWAGIATPAQASRMVHENLLDERTFNAPYGVRTLSKLEKMYNLRATHNPSNWQGPIWGISNYMVFRGLVDYGFEREARQLAEKTIALFGSDLQKEGALHEYYNPDTGSSIMNKGFQNWNYLVLNMIAWIEGRSVVREFSQGNSQEAWVGTWAAAPQPTSENMKPKTSMSGATVRQTVRVSIGGESLRLQLSNRYADGPLHLREVYVADALDSCNIDLQTVRRVTFGGRSSVTIAAGAEMFSDAITFRLKPLGRLSITMVYGESPKEITCHNGSFSTSYILAGATTPATDFSPAERQHHWYNLAAVDVLRDDALSIAILGNSITDGHGATMDAFSTWPDVMAGLLKNTGVLNLGIGANCVFRNRGMGEPAIRRFDHDILGQRGLQAVIVLQGVNDIGGMKGDSMLVESTVDSLIAAYRDFIGKAHQRRLKIYGATITPFLHCVKYYRPCHEQVRQRVNRFIRESGEFDGVIDFDRVVRNPSDTLSLRPDYHCGDWLHPNDAGYKAMGECAASVWHQLVLP